MVQPPSFNSPQSPQPGDYQPGDIPNNETQAQSPYEQTNRLDPIVQPSYNTPPRAGGTFNLRSLDAWTIGIIAAISVLALMCLAATCLAAVVILRTPPPPATIPPQASGVPALGLNTPIVITISPPVQPIVVPSLNPQAVGIFVNPYDDANLAGMTAIQIDVLNAQTNAYETKGTITGADLDTFTEVFNISAVSQKPDAKCPNAVRFIITRANATQATIGACLNGAIILRGADIPDLGGADLPMGPKFIDVLAPYLPDTYLAQLR